jgi:hypothetical protein
VKKKGGNYGKRFRMEKKRTWTSGYYSKVSGIAGVVYFEGGCV